MAATTCSQRKMALSHSIKTTSKAWHLSRTVRVHAPVRRAGPGPLRLVDTNDLSAFPKHRTAEFGELVEAGGDGEEMVAGELSDLAREMHAAIGQKDLGFADAARVDDHMAGGRKAGVVFVRQSKVELPERNPDRFAAPSHVDDLVLIRQQSPKRRAGFRSCRRLETGVEIIGSGLNPKPVRWLARHFVRAFASGGTQQSPCQIMSAGNGSQGPRALPSNKSVRTRLRLFLPWRMIPRLSISTLSLSNDVPCQFNISP